MFACAAVDYQSVPSLDRSSRIWGCEIGGEVGVSALIFEERAKRKGHRGSKYMKEELLFTRSLCPFATCPSLSVFFLGCNILE